MDANNAAFAQRTQSVCIVGCPPKMFGADRISRWIKFASIRIHSRFLISTTKPHAWIERFACPLQCREFLRH